MTGYGPGLRGEPKWLYSADGGHKKNALSPEIDAPHRNGANKTHDDWPANDPGLTRSRCTRDEGPDSVRNQSA